MAEVVRSDGKKFEIECDWVGDENAPNDWVKDNCFVSGTSNPKCPLWLDCWTIYTKRRNRGEFV